ncbi:MAG: protein kinase [Ktedonobacteraceae bacterium]
MGDRIGQQLGNYRLIRLLGEGGFAEVYLGEHIHLGTNAAIKVLRTQLGSEDASAFGTEARTIAHLVHPHIVRVLEFGIEGRTPFLVMDYAPNGTLRQRHLKGTVLTPTNILPYIKQTAAALQYAHDQKLIHRDIKPENMLLGRTNEILLSDFGIALVAQSSRYQNTQDVVGTVAYMSPEQIQGKPRPASDQYSLAIVAYEWLSGDRPFHGSFTELCTQHMFATPTPIRAKLSSVSPAVDQVLQTALSKDPHQRFGSMQAFANAFEQAIQPGRVPNISSTQSRQRTEKVAPPPPQPHTVYAPPPPPIASGGYPAYGNYSGYAGGPNYSNPNGTGGSYAPAQQIRQQKLPRHPWSIGKREILAAIIGTLIYGVSLYIFDSQLISSYSDSPLQQILYRFDINGISMVITPSTILYELIIAIAIFIAVAYGPWVGMFTAGIGTYIAEYAAYHTNLFNSQWDIYSGLALIALIASIAYMKARGNNKTGTPIFSAIFWTIIGLVIGGGFIGYCDTQIYHDTSIGWTEFAYWTIPQSLVVIVAFIIGLSIFNSSTKSSQQRQGYR